MIEKSHLHYQGREGADPVPLDLCIDQCGHYALAARTRHTHPAPPVNRLLLFAGGGFADLTFAGRAHRLDANRFWLIPLHRTITLRYAPRGHFYFVHFTAKSAGGMDIFRRLDAPVVLPAGPALRRAYVAAFTGHTAVASLRLQAAVTDLVARFADRPDVLALWREDSLHTAYRAVLDHIRTRNHPGLRLAELARIAGLKQDDLRKGFRRSMGMPLKAYLMSDLLHKSLDLLLGTNLNITEIAERLGYSSPFYFERVFKRAMRHPPLRYRKDSREWIGR
jgi:AraC-like DNA-binding protein